MNILANISKMFETIEPWDVSNSVANLGPAAGQLTWGNAMRIAEDYKSWLVSGLGDACEGMRQWARETGAWEREEIARWTGQECLALFVQNVASELRMLGSDDMSLEDCIVKYSKTDWDKESEYPIGYYHAKKTKLVGNEDGTMTCSPDGDMFVDYPGI